MTSIPSPRACSTSTAFVTPQSQVMTSVTPAAASRSRPPTREAISLGQARRHVAHRLDPQRSQGEHPDHHGGHPIGVVVAPDGDPLARIDGALDAASATSASAISETSCRDASPACRKRAELLVVAEPATGQQGRHGTPEAGERRRVRKRLREQPFEARDDHPAMVAASRLPRTYRSVIGRRQRAAGLAFRASASAFALRFESHSYQAASSWLALKIDE